MILLNDYNGFSDIMTMPLDFFWIWVEISDLSATLVTEVTVTLVGETIRSVLQVDRAGLRNGLRLVGLCMDYMILNHGRLACPRALEMTTEPKEQTGGVVTDMAPPMVFRACSQPILVVPNLLALFKEK
ncbi:hypothetical protein ACLB2K_052270 [Fragaria x ananassa]